MSDELSKKSGAASSKRVPLSSLKGEKNEVGLTSPSSATRRWCRTRGSRGNENLMLSAFHLAHPDGSGLADVIGEYARRR